MKIVWVTFVLLCTLLPFTPLRAQQDAYEVVNNYSRVMFARAIGTPNVRVAPSANAGILQTNPSFQTSAPIVVLRGVRGDAVNGNDVWYEVVDINARQGFIWSGNVSKPTPAKLAEPHCNARASDFERLPEDIPWAIAGNDEAVMYEGRIICISDYRIEDAHGAIPLGSIWVQDAVHPQRIVESIPPGFDKGFISGVVVDFNVASQATDTHASSYWRLAVPVYNARDEIIYYTSYLILWNATASEMINSDYEFVDQGDANIGGGSSRTNSFPGRIIGNYFVFDDEAAVPLGINMLYAFYMPTNVTLAEFYGAEAGENFTALYNLARNQSFLTSETNAVWRNEFFNSETWQVRYDFCISGASNRPAGAPPPPCELFEALFSYLPYHFPDEVQLLLGDYYFPFELVKDFQANNDAFCIHC